MSIKKERHYVNSSAIGSYFGVGFNSPSEQLEIDLGNVAPDFTDEAKRRMYLGQVLEDPVLDWWEKELSIIIFSERLISKNFS